MAANLNEGDSIIICSDGLTTMLLDEEIKHELLTLAPAKAVKQLVDKANLAGGLDNISIVLLKRPLNLRAAHPAPSTRRKSQKKANRKNPIWMMGLVIFIMSALSIGLYIWQKPKEDFTETTFRSSLEKIAPVETNDAKSFEDYPDSALGNQKFYVRLGTFPDSISANVQQLKISKVLPNKNDLSLSNIDTFYELRTRFFDSRDEAQSYLSKYLVQREGIIINASNE